MDDISAGPSTSYSSMEIKKEIKEEEEEEIEIVGEVKKKPPKKKSIRELPLPTVRKSDNTVVLNAFFIHISPSPLLFSLYHFMIKILICSYHPRRIRVNYSMNICLKCQN